MVPLVNSISLQTVLDISDSLTSYHEVDHALRQVDITRRLITGPPVFLPFQIEARLIEALARKTGQRHLGAVLGQRFDYSKLSWYAEYVLTARTLGEAFLRGAKALPVMNPGCGVSVERKSDAVSLSFYSGIQHVTGARHIDEGLPFMLIDLARRFLGSEWTPLAIEVPKPPGKSNGVLEDIYGVPISYVSAGAGILLKPTCLNAPNPKASNASKKIFLRDLPDMLQVSPPTSFAETIGALMRPQMVLGDISIEAVSERLALGPQTVQRKLRAEGTSFREIRNNFLKERAQDLLQDSNHSIREIANALGYDEPNSFRRAFRSWTGLTPTEFCRQKP